MKKLLKKLTVVATLAGMMVCMTACGKKDVVKDDLYAYLTQMTEVQEAQKSAITEYNTCVANPEADSQQLQTALNDSIIPKYESYITQLNGVAPETEEVQNLHASCVDAANKQLEALKKVSEAIAACDTDMLADADALISEAELLFDSYETQVETLASEHEITLMNLGNDATESVSEEPVAE